MRLAFELVSEYSRLLSSMWMGLIQPSRSESKTKGKGRENLLSLTECF